MNITLLHQRAHKPMPFILTRCMMHEYLGLYDEALNTLISSQDMFIIKKHLCFYNRKLNTNKFKEEII